MLLSEYQAQLAELIDRYARTDLIVASELNGLPPPLPPQPTSSPAPPPNNPPLPPGQAKSLFPHRKSPEHKRAGCQVKLLFCDDPAAAPGFVDTYFGDRCKSFFRF
jgi:hypothetical protein